MFQITISSRLPEAAVVDGVVFGVVVGVVVGANVGVVHSLRKRSKIPRGHWDTAIVRPFRHVI